MTTLKSLQKKLKPYKNTLVLNGFNVVRLVDVIDGEDEYYWVYDEFKKGITHWSCLIGWIPLKGNLSQKDYKETLRLWNLNNTEKAI